MNPLARWPSGVYEAIAARSMSPVAMCGIPKTLERRAACVPFPTPGGPNSRRFSLNARLLHGSDGLASARRARSPRSATPDPGSARPGESFVVAGDEVRLDLLDRVERDADDDHQAGAAEVERHLHLLVQQRRQDADGRHVNRAAEGNAGQHLVDVSRRRLSGADAGDEAAV